MLVSGQGTFQISETTNIGITGYRRKPPKLTVAKHRVVHMVAPFLMH